MNGLNLFNNASVPFDCRAITGEWADLGPVKRQEDARSRAAQQPVASVDEGPYVQHRLYFVFVLAHKLLELLSVSQDIGWRPIGLGEQYMG